MTTPGEEAVRKTIHLVASLIAAGVVLWLPPLEAATLLAAATTLALTVELARRISDSFGPAFHRMLGPLLRDREAGRLTGATTLAIGFTIAAVLFPGVPALAGILVAGVADALAAVVGKRFGRVRYPGGKSLEGSITFLLVTFPLLWSLTGAGAGVLAGVAIALTLLEALTLRIHDNLYLPVASAAAIHYAVPLTGLAFFS